MPAGAGGTGATRIWTSGRGSPSTAPAAAPHATHPSSPGLRQGVPRPPPAILSSPPGLSPYSSRPTYNQMPCDARTAVRLTRQAGPVPVAVLPAASPHPARQPPNLQNLLNICGKTSGGNSQGVELRGRKFDLDSEGEREAMHSPSSQQSYGACVQVSGNRGSAWNSL